MPSRRRGLERLVRKILRMPAHPALLYYHYWPPQWPLYNGTFWHGGEHFSEVGPADTGLLQCSLACCSLASLDIWA